MSEIPFPVVSFKPFLTGTEEEQQKVAQELYDAFHKFGWIYLKDFGISQDEIEEMFAISKTYFDRPLEIKMKDRLVDAAVNQGYTPDGAETNAAKQTDHKESYEHRRWNNDLCPSDGEMAGFREFMDEFYAKLHALSHHVLRALALILKLPATYFEPFLAEANPQLRLLHYMPIPKSTIMAAGNARINPHTDFGLCTILFQDMVGGLEVDPFHTGSFVPATPVPGTCVINVADLLQRLSNDKLRSTMHRVTAPKVTRERFEKMDEDELLPARYSTAFFVHPSADVEIKPVLLEGEESKYEVVNAGVWRNEHTAFNYALPVPTQ